METRRDSTALALAGGAFLLLAGFFLWRDLPAERALLALAGLAVAGVGAALGRPRSVPALAPAALLAGTLATGLWYLMQRSSAVLPALAVSLVAAVVAVVRAEHVAVPSARALGRLRWYTLGVAILAASWAFYFHFLTVGVAADTVARRLVPTLVWLSLGLALFVAGRRRAEPAISAEVGAGLALIALGKAAAYDTTHLHGPLRVAVLAAVGALLLFGARLLQRPSPSPAGAA